jgi:hypothetical protein
MSTQFFYSSRRVNWKCKLKRIQFPRGTTLSILLDISISHGGSEKRLKKMLHQKRRKLIHEVQLKHQAGRRVWAADSVSSPMIAGRERERKNRQKSEMESQNCAEHIVTQQMLERNVLHITSEAGWEVEKRRSRFAERGEERSERKYLFFPLECSDDVIYVIIKHHTHAGAMKSHLDSERGGATSTSERPRDVLAGGCVRGEEEAKLISCPVSPHLRSLSAFNFSQLPRANRDCRVALRGPKKRRKN